jgi:mannitol-1-phosphate/altronate dehydrogenase
VELSAGRLPELDVAAPAYDRSGLTQGVVHIGVGGFHRAHQALFHDRLLAAGASEWAICGLGALPGDSRMRDALDAQDGLYTLVERAPGEDNISGVTGGFDPDNEDVAHDLEAGATPRTTFGLVTEALARRRERGLAPFTVMSCDNLQGNGERARGTFTTFARLRDPELGEWVEQHVAFPNSMVDRITPATTDADREAVRERFGIDDRWPVVCEPFIQWVLEDSFCAGRPAYEEVGVQVVEDVEPYELMKLRLLNASHQALAYFGHLLGHEYVHDAAQDEPLRAVVRAYMDEEATPTLPPVPGVDLADYKSTLIERFSNPGVRDTIPRRARRAPTACPSGSCPSSAAGWRTAATCASPPPSWRAGRATRPGPTSRAATSRSSTACAIRSWSSGAARARTRTPSSPTAICSATSRSTSASRSRTAKRSPRSTSEVPVRRSSRCCAEEPSAPPPLYQRQWTRSASSSPPCSPPPRSPSPRTI